MFGKTGLTVINNQRIERQLLKIFKTEVEKSHDDLEIQHTDEVLEENQIVNEWLSFLLKAFEQEGNVVINAMEVSHAIKVTREDIGSLFYDVFTSIQRGVIEYMTAIRKLRDKLCFESKIADKEHKRDITDE